MIHDKTLLATCASHLLAFARRLTRNEADARDLVQDTWLHALEALRKTETPPDNMRAWLLVLMRNHWFNVTRHRKVRASARVELANRDAFDDGLCETRAVCRQLERAWDQLPAQAQRIARQRLIEGESQEDVSREFGITAGGVASSIFRTREQLRQSLFGR